MQPSALTPWDSYALVFLSAGLSLLIPGVLALISRFLLRSIPKKGVGTSQSEVEVPEGALSQRTALGQRINIRFFLAANCALILIALALLILPGVSKLGEPHDPDSVKHLVALVTLALLATLGLLYSTKKGDLSWITTVAPQRGERRP